MKEGSAHRHENWRLLVELQRYTLFCNLGKPYAQALDRAGIVCNYNAIPFDPRKPMDPSGIRIGTPSISSRGMGRPEMAILAGFMDEVAKDPSDANTSRIAGLVREVTARFPAPGLRV